MTAAEEPTGTAPRVDSQIQALTGIVGALAKSVSNLSARVELFAIDLRRSTGERAGRQDDDPAPWVWFHPPASAERDSDQGPETTIANFVTFYNATYVGQDGTRAKPIPPCWQRHPGLAMEVASLAYAWRAANLGADASEREAQHWHHQWRPGFADRLVREWVHTDCLDAEHRPGGSGERPSRFVGDRTPHENDH